MEPLSLVSLIVGIVSVVLAVVAIVISVLNANASARSLAEAREALVRINERADRIEQYIAQQVTELQRTLTQQLERAYPPQPSQTDLFGMRFAMQLFERASPQEMIEFFKFFADQQQASQTSAEEAETTPVQ